MNANVYRAYVRAWAIVKSGGVLDVAALNTIVNDSGPIEQYAAIALAVEDARTGEPLATSAALQARVQTSMT